MVKMICVDNIKNPQAVLIVLIKNVGFKEKKKHFLYENFSYYEKKLYKHIPINHYGNRQNGKQQYLRAKSPC